MRACSNDAGFKHHIKISTVAAWALAVAWPLTLVFLTNHLWIELVVEPARLLGLVLVVLGSNLFSSYETDRALAVPLPHLLNAAPSNAPGNL